MADNETSFRVLLPVALTLSIAAVVVTSSGLSAHHQIDTELAREGLDIWRRENCVACHAVYGLGGHIAPDLTNVQRRRGSAYIARVLKNGTGAMPDLGLSDEEVKALGAYLRHIDGLGQYPLPELNSPPFGINRQ